MSSKNPNLKVKKIRDFIMDEMMYHKRPYFRIKKAFDLRINDQIYKNSNDKSSGDLVADLIKAYVSLVLDEEKLSLDSAQRFLDDRSYRLLRSGRKEALELERLDILVGKLVENDRTTDARDLANAPANAFNYRLSSSFIST